MSEFSIRTQPFRLGFADYRAMWLAESVRSPLAWFLALMALDWAAIFIIQLRLAVRNHGRHLIDLGLCAFWLILAACIAAGALYGWQRRYRRDPVRSGERIMILDAGAVRLIGYGCDIRQSWTAFSRVYRSGSYLFLHAPGQPTYIIPERALASPSDLGRLASLGRAARKTSPDLQRLPETPDSREIWRSDRYKMVLYRPLGHGFLRLLTMTLLVLGLTWLGAVMQSGPQILTRTDIQVFFLAMAALFFLAYLVMVPAIWLVFRRRPDLRGDREISFTRDYVRSTTSVFDSRVDWVNVRKVYRASNVFTFILTTGRIHVPASAFATPAQAMAFYTQAVAFWHAAEARR